MVFRKLPGVSAPGMGLRLSQKFVFLLFLSGLVTLCFGALFFLPDSVRLKRIFLSKNESPAVTARSEGEARDLPRKVAGEPLKVEAGAKLRVSRKPSVTHDARTQERSVGTQERTQERTQVDAVDGARDAAPRDGKEGGKGYDYEMFKKCLLKPALGADRGKPSDPQTVQRRDKVRELCVCVCGKAERECFVCCACVDRLLECHSSCRWCGRGGGGGTPDRPFILVLTTVPPHTDSLGVSTKTKAGLVTEDDAAILSHSMTVWPRGGLRLGCVQLEPALVDKNRHTPSQAGSYSSPSLRSALIDTDKTAFSSGSLTAQAPSFTSDSDRIASEMSGVHSPLLELISTAQTACPGPEWQRVIFSDESRFSLGGDAQRTRVWRHRGQHQDGQFVVTRPEGLVSLHLHPYRTICRNCVRMFKLHGMDYHRTPLGTSTAPYRDVWHVGLASTAARRHTERQTSAWAAGSHSNCAKLRGRVCERQDRDREALC
ncbi:hypothetical protein NFI96_001279 [Prochilodus magdalenae]|nr:hypothetical protein NFI96_001279 [Prochilodus magdalenae]